MLPVSHQLKVEEVFGAECCDRRLVLVRKCRLQATSANRLAGRRIPSANMPQDTDATMNGVADEYDYDLFVIGAGSGGVRASRMSAGFGAKVSWEAKFHASFCWVLASDCLAICGWYRSGPLAACTLDTVIQ